MARHVVAAVGDIPPDGQIVVTVRGRAIAVFNVDGAYYALLDRCPHEGARLSRGTRTGLVESDCPGRFMFSRKGEFIRCPWHGWEYDIKTGQSWCDPLDVKVRQFSVRRESGESLAKGPYVAESFPVSVDQDYIVVEV